MYSIGVLINILLLILSIILFGSLYIAVWSMLLGVIIEGFKEMRRDIRLKYYKDAAILTIALITTMISFLIVNLLGIQIIIGGVV